MSSSSSAEEDAAAAAMPPPGSPSRAATITRTPSGSGASASRNSPFTPRARKTALDRLPVHLLSFEDLSDDEEHVGGQMTASASQKEAPAPATTALAPKAATATALRTWGADGDTATSAKGGSGFTLSADDLEFHSRIAEGAYGVVWRARLRPGWRRRGRRRSSAVAAAAPDGEQQQQQQQQQQQPQPPPPPPPAQQQMDWELEEGKPQEVAIKVQRVPPGEEDEQGQANLLIELSVLQGLVHPRLVRYHGAALLTEAEARARKEWRPLLVRPGQVGVAAEGGCLGGAIEETCSKEEAPPSSSLLVGAEEAKVSGGEPQQPNDEAPSAEGGGSAASTLVLIAMEYCVRGSLREALQASAAAGTPLPWPLRVRLAADVAEGLAFLHEHGLLHRDLKTSNVVLDRGFRAKLCDHSFAAAAHSPDLAAFTCGTDEFLAPEAALGEPPGYDKPSDVFSLGVVLCEIITGREPGKDGFLERTARDLFQLDPEEVEAAVPPECPASLRMLALHCAQNEPLDRPTAAEAQEWAASLLGELAEGGEEGEEGVALPKCLSPLPWPLAEQVEEPEEQEPEAEAEVVGVPVIEDKGETEKEAGAKARKVKVSWAQVAMRGADSHSSSSSSSSPSGSASQQQAHGHKRALSTSTSASASSSSSASATAVLGGKRWAQDGEDGSRPLPPHHESLPGLLGGAGERTPRRNRGKTKGGRGAGGGGGGGAGGQRGRRGGRGEGGGSKNPKKGSPGQRNSGVSVPQPEPSSPSPRIRGRVGSLDHSLSLSMSSSLAASAFARGHLGTPNSPLPSTFAAAVIGGAQGAGSSATSNARATATATPTAGGMDTLVQGVEGMRLATGGEGPRQRQRQSPPLPLPLHDKELPFAGQLAATGWEQRMGQAQARFQAQLGALRRELDAAEAEAKAAVVGEQQGEGARRRRLAVLREVEALERAVKEVEGAVAAVGEAVAAFRGRVARG